MEYLIGLVLALILAFAFSDLAWSLETILIKAGLLKDNTVKTDLDNKHINEIATVIKTIPKEMNGKIILHGVEWLAKNINPEEIKEGEKVKILKLESTTMVVTNEIT